MKKIGIMISAAAALMMAGCAKDMTGTPEAGGVATLYATVEGSDNTTRVGFDQSGSFYWSEGDQIGVMTDMNPDGFTVLSINSGVGENSASFSGEVGGRIEGYAVYPYSKGHSVSGTALTYIFPSEYNYTKVETDFFSAEKGQGNSFNAPMWGKIDGNSVQFKHLGGVFCVKIDKMPYASGTLTFSADQQINGTYDIDLSGSENPAFTVETASDEAGKSVAITFDGAVAGESGVFYIPVPTGDYTNVAVSISDQDGGNRIIIPCGNYHIDRAMLKALYPKVAAGGSTTAGSAMDVVTAIGYGEKAITVAPDVTDLTICGNDNNDPISISYAQIPNGDLSIGYDPNLPIASQLVVAMPYDEVNSAAPNVTIDMFNTSVTLAATTGKAVYGTVTLEASGELLVVDSGVTVSELVIRRSNIRVKRDSHIKRIVNESALEVKIYYEDGAWLPIDIPQGVTVVYE